MRTSPVPETKVCSASRPDFGWTLTCLVSSVLTYGRPLAPTAAIRFHFAAPELNGLGVTTWTPGLTRSSHVLMFLGLPLRTTKLTTDVETHLFSAPSETRPALTRRSRSGSSEKATTSAFWPASTARLWSPDAP